MSAYASTIDVQKDGSLKIAEKLNFTFGIGEFSFAYRDIPWKGFDDIKDITVLNQTNTSIPYSLSFASGNYHIQWNYPITDAPASRVFTIRYTVTNALVQLSANQDRLDWQAVGPGWQVPIQNVRVDVNLPARWNASVLAYSPAPAGISQSLDNTTLTFLYSQLAPFTFYRVIVDFPKVLDVSLNPIRLIRDSPFTVTLLTFFLATVGMVGLWFVRGRAPKADSEQGLSSPIQFPPSSLTPEEVGCLLKQSIDFRSIMAALINLAKKGYIIMHGVASEGKLDPLSPPFEVTEKWKNTIQDPTKTSELPEHERTLLRGIIDFPFSLSGVLEVERKFTGQIYDRLTQAGFFVASPRHVRVRYALSGAVVGLLSIAFLVAGIDFAPLFSFEGIYGGLLSGALPIVIVGYFMPRLTSAGVLERAKWVGFLGYVRDRVDSLRRISPNEAVDMLDKYVEFTPIVPGISLEYWMKGLALDLQRVPYAPEWYVIYPWYGSAGPAAIPGAPVNVTSSLANDFGTFAQSLASSFGHYQAAMAPMGGGAGGGEGGGGGGGGGGGAG